MAKRRVRIRPWHALAASIATSVVGGALVTSVGLRSRERAGASRWVALAGGIGGAVWLVAIAMLRLPSQPVAALFAAGNVAAGLVFAGMLRRTEPEAVAPEERRVTVGHILWNALGSALVMLYVGAGAGVLYLLALDTWVSTLFPSIASRFSVIAAVIGVGVGLAPVGFVLGGSLAARPEGRGPSAYGWAITGAVLGFLVADLLGTLVISIPAFQGQALQLAASPSALATSALASVMTLGAACVAALATGTLLADRAAQPLAARVRLLTGVTITVAAGMVSLAIYSGRIGYDLLLGGELLEKQGRLAAARALYERGIAQRPDDAASAHLQYRLAMLHRGEGDADATRAAFANIVTTYTKRPDLVARAQRFLTALDRAKPDARRHIVPEITTRTEFKSAYCMPNSLALVIRYWGVPLTARQIGRDVTMMDVGTTVSDASWYVQTNGLEQWLMPLASIDDIRRFLDQDLPLLVYVPHHVLVVIGYDDALQSLVTYDVATEQIWIDQPLDEFLPKWRGEFAVIGVVLPPSRFATLPRELRSDLERWTRAYLHHDLHYQYHRSSDSVDLRRALAHLQTSVEAAPDLFFDVAHVAVRPRWAHARRAELFRADVLGAAAESGLAFTRYDFDSDEPLREIAVLNLELGRYDALQRFLEDRAKDGSLKLHPDLESLLGLLKYRADDMEGAVAHLGSLADDRRFPFVLGRAFERTNALESAIAEYGHVVELTDAPNEEMDPHESMLETLKHLARRRQSSQLFFAPRTPSLHARAQAMRRISDLAERLGDSDRIIAAARTYLEAFRWDADIELRYAEAVETKLARQSDLPHDAQEDLRRELTRAAAFAAALDVNGRRRDRVARVAAASSALTSP